MNRLKKLLLRDTGIVKCGSGVCGFFLITAMLAPMCIQALPSDRNQTIYIQSDHFKRNGKKGITVYEGAVQMSQGTIQINADKITIYSVDNKMNRIIASGNPAQFQQQPAEDKERVIAKGTTIEYLVAKEKVFLVNNASIVQDGATMSGERINYDIKDAVVTAVGNPTSADNKRIQIVIPPQADN